MSQSAARVSLQSGSLFIDRNHANLSETAKGLVDQWQKGIDVDKFKDIARGFVAELTNHFQHEEMFLKSADFKGLVKHEQKHADILDSFNELVQPEATKETIQNFVWSAQTTLFEHELMDDQEFWGEFAPLDPSLNFLITWSSEYETGNQNMDSHHAALASYINRSYIRASTENWSNLLEGELRHIKTYSEHHFAEEEKGFDKNNPNHQSHIISHQKLLTRLETVIEEVADDKYDLDDLFDFLKNWLIYHITHMDKRDIPS